MSRSKLCISWIQRQFIAVRIAGGEMGEIWESPTPVMDLPEFNIALAGAVEALEVNAGEDVFMVYESDFLSHPLVPMPSMNTRDRSSFLERRARQEKTFEEDAVWSFTRTLASRDGTSVLLHLIPKTFVDALIRICEEFKLYPVSMLPLSDAMSLQVGSLSGDADEICLLLNLFPDQCEILVARGDGVILFVRDLGYNWKGNEDRLGIEIERSLLFSGQHFNGNISRMWISGQGSAGINDYLRDHVRIPMVVLSAEMPIDWIHVTETPSSHLHSNLIPRAIRKKRMMMWMFRGSAMLLLLFGLLSAFTVWKIEMTVRAQGAHTREVMANIDQWQRKQDNWMDKETQLKKISRRRMAFDKSIIPPAAPAWFAQYVASVLPKGMVLSHISMQRIHDRITQPAPDEHAMRGGWRFSIQGMLIHAHEAAFPRILKGFEAALISPPLAAHITQSWRMDWLKQIHTGRTGESNVRTFVIKGLLP